jgi:PBP1b-binding outer membrane lipoprotein LpoB
MKPFKQRAAVLLLALSLVACSSGEDKSVKPDANVEPEEDAQIEPVDEPDADVEPTNDAEVDAGAPTSDPVPLTVWVDDLVDHHTTDEAIPDTVDDKKIADDTDETSFDKYLPK